jgi:DNA-binding IclR family transcriptional regulator
MAKSTHLARSVVSKISVIVLAMSEGSRTLTEIATRSALPLSTVHRLSTEMALWHLLERTPDGSYQAGQLLLALDRSRAEPTSVPDRCVLVRDRAAPVMEDLQRAVGVRVRVGFLGDGLDVVYVEKGALHRPVSRPCAAARLPVHATALGKALLAFSPPAVLEAVLAHRLPRYTARTVTDPQQLRAACRASRTTRLAVSDRELDQHSRAIAVPVFGEGGIVVAAIELQARDLAADIAAWRSALAVAAGSLSRDLARHVEPGRGAGPRWRASWPPLTPDPAPWSLGVRAGTSAHRTAGAPTASPA